MTDSKRPSLLRRLLRIERPESPQAARPRTVPVPLQRVSGAVMLPKDTLVVPATAELVEAVARSTPEAPGPWVAVLEEAAFQSLQKEPPSAPVLCTLAQPVRSGPGGGGREAGLALRGMTRAWVHAVAPSGLQFTAEVVPVESPELDAAKLEPLAAELRALGKQLLRQRPAGPFYLSAATVDAVREPDGLADLLVAWWNPDLDTRRQVLAAVDVEARLRLVINVLKAQLLPVGSAR